jgi:hypothetical protein
VCLVRVADHTAHRDGRGDDHVGEFVEQVIGGPADAFSLVQAVDADVGLGDFADLFGELARVEFWDQAPGILCYGTPSTWRNRAADRLSLIGPAPAGDGAP